jgi:hypothetical protein
MRFSVAFHRWPNFVLASVTLWEIYPAGTTRQTVAASQSVRYTQRGVQFSGAAGNTCVFGEASSGSAGLIIEMNDRLTSTSIQHPQGFNSKFPGVRLCEERILRIGLVMG